MCRQQLMSSQFSCTSDGTLQRLVLLGGGSCTSATGKEETASCAPSKLRSLLSTLGLPRSTTHASPRSRSHDTGISAPWMGSSLVRANVQLLVFLLALTPTCLCKTVNLPNGVSTKWHAWGRIHPSTMHAGKTTRWLGGNASTRSMTQLS